MSTFHDVKKLISYVQYLADQLDKAFEKIHVLEKDVLNYDEFDMKKRQAAQPNFPQISNFDAETMAMMESINRINAGVMPWDEPTARFLKALIVPRVQMIDKNSIKHLTRWFEELEDYEFCSFLTKHKKDEPDHTA